ncbi:hypothetical protein ABEB36_004439 [Hypothenemus hampei]|uniref:Uncharacterized protein n=1 Tax=Hypothenemus hampei TaxID=57062 RepID=A0ABD1F3C8_HYPHA
MLLKRVNLSCYVPLKVWAMAMAMKNMILGISIILGGSLWLKNNEVLDTFKTYFACGVFIAIANFVAAILMIIALYQGKDNILLVYLLIEFVIVFTLSIFTFVSSLGPNSMVFIILFLLCSGLWLGFYNVYKFYLELHEYNNGSVRAGIDEISCQINTNPLESFPEKVLETTTV